MDKEKLEIANKLMKKAIEEVTIEELTNIAMKECDLPPELAAIIAKSIKINSDSLKLVPKEAGNDRSSL